jgi:hypothetical protein
MELALRSFSHEKGYSAPLIERIGIDGFQSPLSLPLCCCACVPNLVSQQMHGRGLK